MLERTRQSNDPARVAFDQVSTLAAGVEPSLKSGLHDRRREAFID
jgi:hypothetical protein